MFLKRNRRTKNGETYEYWSLVETVRTERGPRHRVVSNLGKLPGLERKHRHSWENLAHLLDGSQPNNQEQLTFDDIIFVAIPKCIREIHRHAFSTLWCISPRDDFQAVSCPKDAICLLPKQRNPS